MERPNWEEVFMAFAHELSKRSTCIRAKTGAILIKEGRILSMGYTGAGPGLQHCEKYWQEYHHQEWAAFVESGGYEAHKRKKAEKLEKKKEKMEREKEKQEKESSKIPVANKSTLASRARSASFDINEEKMRALQLEIAVLKKRNGIELKEKEKMEKLERKKEKEKEKEKLEKEKEKEKLEKSSSKSYLVAAKGPKSSFRKFVMSDKFIELHNLWAHENEIHAEINCILNARESCNGSILFAVTSPCMECAKYIHGAKVYKVYYDELKDRKGVEFLAKNGIQCININAIVHEPVEFSLSSDNESESTV